MSGRTTKTFHKRKHCRVQFSLYRDVNIRFFFGERKSTSNRKDNYRKGR